MEGKEEHYVRLLNDEYERMYYGVCSTELTEDFEHLLKVIFKGLLKEVEEALIEKQENIDKIALQTQLGDLYKVFYQGVETPLKIFKREIQRLLLIPDNVILPGTELHNKYKDKIYSDNEINSLENDISYLQNEILQEKVFVAKLQQEKNLINTKLQVLFNNINAVVSPLKALLSGINGKTTKLLDLHEKTFETYLEKINENSIEKNTISLDESYIEDTNFHGWD